MTTHTTSQYISYQRDVIRRYARLYRIPIDEAVERVALRFARKHRPQLAA